jgi:hypothetical protein
MLHGHRCICYKLDITKYIFFFYYIMSIFLCQKIFFKNMICFFLQDLLHAKQELYNLSQVPSPFVSILF